MAWLFVNVARSFARAATAAKPTLIPQIRLMTPQERQQVLNNIRPDELRYAGWRDANSSWIEKQNYNPIVPFGQMLVRRTKKIYTFGQMTLETYKAWVNSGSRGMFFNRYLRGRYSRWSGAGAGMPDVFAFASGGGSSRVSRT